MLNSPSHSPALPGRPSASHQHGHLTAGRLAAGCRTSTHPERPYCHGHRPRRVSRPCYCAATWRP
eukprot:scaffold1146_cov399-Prasinococcus_capsulatus_cf.AAC.66